MSAASASADGGTKRKPDRHGCAGDERDTLVEAGFPR
jgi:hypothetical protein